MKKTLILLLTAILALLPGVACAAEGPITIDVIAQCQRPGDGVLTSALEAGRAAVVDSEGRMIVASGAPEEAVELVVIPACSDARSWLEGVLGGFGTSLIPYSIYFLTPTGEKIAVDGVRITVFCQDTLSNPFVCSVSPSGEVSFLDMLDAGRALARSKTSSITFTADGREVFVIGERMNPPVGGGSDENATAGGEGLDLPPTSIPDTADPERFLSRTGESWFASAAGVCLVVGIVAGCVLGSMCFLKKRRLRE
ncbi:hypothetical protein [Gordonibacter massiliensis (ex Traore et al. 2017)]|uniref:hypothetical protein n=1 Tax=Gordonibacter massiliensis (ex Traore et al. 2017) TaxID=1841863 RepID=UPI001C8C5158|nr:hypothetical protein [Gordonibacter massiliensis (ex Traore et al. 2017)]MBX9035108.1 hypothetical protein [Gordonibacter massiliensis (ex Traore et al. 2017)]